LASAFTFGPDWPLSLSMPQSGVLKQKDDRETSLVLIDFAI